jgi:hypothetical protein
VLLRLPERLVFWFPLLDTRARTPAELHKLLRKTHFFVCVKSCTLLATGLIERSRDGG